MHIKCKKEGEIVLDNYNIRIATLADLDQIVSIYEDAKRLLKASGSDQWQSGYPNHDTVKSDIFEDNLYILIRNDIIIGVAYFGDQGEKTYHKIDGTWLNDEPYLVIHRIATRDGYYGMGVAKALFNFGEKLALEKGIYNIRVDTHKQNLTMLSLLSKLNYHYCGIIDLGLPKPFDSTRLAYQKILRN